MNKGLRERFSGGSFANTKTKFNTNFSGGLRIRGKRIRFLGLGSAFALALIAAATVAPLQRTVQYTEAASGPASETVLTIATTDYPTLDLSVNNLGGTFTETAAGSGQGSFNVTTTNYTGYKLTISASDDDDGALINSSDNSSSIASIGSAVSASTFSSDTYKDTYNGHWGYKPSKLNSSTNTNYLPAPTTEPTVLDITSTPNSTANDYTIDLAARLQYTQGSGEYAKTFILAAVGNFVPYSITYTDTTGDASVSGLPAIQHKDSGEPSESITSITLSSVSPTRTGYTFAGWCDGTATNASGVNGSCSGTTYQPGASFTINQTTSNNVTLTAIWNPIAYTCTKQYRLQNADGSYPGGDNPTASDYTPAGTEQVNFSATCNYEQAVADYTTQSTSGTMTVGGIILSLDLPRTTYALTVNKNDTYISAVTGAGTYRWGQTVDITATAGDNKFKGWSQTAGTTGSFGDATSASTTFTMPKSNATIYADGEPNATYMQNWTGCSSMSIGETITLTDSRDNTQYLVGKLKRSSSDTGTTGGWCWMLDNLALDLSDSAVQANLTSATTNAPDANLTTLKSNVIAKTATGGSWTNSYTAPYIATSGTENGGWDTNTVASVKYGSGSGKIGIYYNYCAASAGTYCYSSSSSSGNTSADVCPAGWRLPTGASSGEFQTLYSAYGSNHTNFTTALSTPLSGYFYSGSAYNQGSYGYWWSSTRYNNTGMYGLGVAASSVSPQNDYSRNGGFSIRCILK